MWPKPDALREFYGNPDSNNDGTADQVWESKHLVSVVPAFKMRLAWDIGREVSTIRCHTLVAHSLTTILAEIDANYGYDQQKIEHDGLHLYGGCYNFRLMRGGTKLSVHSYGAAIDINPSANPLGRNWEPGHGMIPLAVVKIFEDAGWQWGGRWTRPDCQHFQATSK